MSTIKILLISATELEIAPLIQNGAEIISDNTFSKRINNTLVTFLITGIGIHSMTYTLTNHLANNSYSFIILAGIAGSYSKKYKIGDIVNVSNERFSDLGQISDNGFDTLFDMGLQDKNQFPFSDGKMENYTLINNSVVNQLPKVKANTIQTIRSKKAQLKNSNAEIESMEGAAFFFVCMMEKQAFIQIRAISNYVGEMDKSKWNIPLAVSNLSITIMSLIKEI